MSSEYYRFKISRKASCQTVFNLKTACQLVRCNLNGDFWPYMIKNGYKRQQIDALWHFGRCHKLMAIICNTELSYETMNKIGNIWREKYSNSHRDSLIALAILEN